MDMNLLSSVQEYYSEKVRQHGATPLGVDWSCVPTQEMRFVQLLKLCDFADEFSLNDVGCGYGALVSYLKKKRKLDRVDYLGTDLSEEMISCASKRWSRHSFVRFAVEANTSRRADYSVASGIFNVKLGNSNNCWERSIEQSLHCMFAASLKGIAVNFLIPPLREDAKINELYYAPAERWAAYLVSEFAADIEIVSGYGLKEQTLLARRRSPTQESRH